MFSAFPKYQRLQDEDETPDKSTPTHLPPHPRAARLHSLTLLGSIFLSFLLGIATCAAALRLLARGDLSSRSHDLVWHPSLTDSLSKRWIKFKGGLFTETLYRGKPNQSIDDAWARYTESPWFDGGAVALRVSEEDIRQARKAGPEDWFNSTVELGEENGGGYMGTLEIFHQLHCLDMIRRYTYPEYYPIEDFRTRKEFMRDHIDHCIDMLRQVLMCYSDTGLVTFHWVESKRVPMPDFNTWHQCRDPEDVLSWAKRHAAPMKNRIFKPDGAIERPSLW